MSKVTIIKLLDDLSGGAADETVIFEIDGTRIEIDLSDHNAAGLRNTLRPYIDAGRKLTGRAHRATPPRLGQTASAARGVDANGVPKTYPRAVREGYAQRQAIRAWLRSQGFAVGDKGTIKQEWVDLYNREAGNAMGAKADKGLADIAAGQGVPRPRIMMPGDADYPNPHGPTQTVFSQVTDGA